MFVICNSIAYKDKHNQAIVNILVQEVMGLNPSFLTQHIRGKSEPLINRALVTPLGSRMWQCFIVKGTERTRAKNRTVDI